MHKDLNKPFSPKGSVVFFHRNMRFDGNSINERPVGGMETSLIYMARELARLGWDVKVFNHCERPGIYDGVAYVPVEEINTYKATHETDVFISVRYLDPFNADLNSKLRILWTGDAFDQPFLKDLHDRTIVNNIDKIFAKSRWHAQTLAHTFNIRPEKFYVTRNGINLENFRANGIKRKKGKIVYSSTPFRGLDVLLDTFPRIRSQVPYAELFVFSGLAVYGLSAEKDREKYSHIYAKANQPGVHLIGNILQKQLAEELMSSQLMLYPNHFPETCCLAALEAQAAGVPVITSALGALTETVEDGFSGVLIPGDSREAGYQDRMVKEAVSLLQDEDRWQRFSKQAAARIEASYPWEKIALDWESEFEKCQNYIGNGKTRKILEEQLRVCIEMLEKNPSNSGIYLEVASICEELGHTEDAHFFREKASNIQLPCI